MYRRIHALLTRELVLDWDRPHNRTIGVSIYVNWKNFSIIILEHIQFNQLDGRVFACRQRRSIIRSPNVSEH